MLNKLKQELQEKKKQQNKVQFLSVEERRKQAEAEKSKLLLEKQEAEKEKHEKLVKKLKSQDDYYKTTEIDKVQIKRLQDQKGEETQRDTANILLELIENQVDLPPIERKEVQRRLRDFGQPITYFGENDWQRYKRLMQAEQKRIDNCVENTDLFTKQQQVLELYILDGEDREEVEQFMNKIKERNLDPDTALVPVFNQMHSKEEVEKYLLDGVSLLTRCEDVHLWCRKMLREWNIKLEQKFSEVEKRSLEGTLAFSAYKQTLDYIKPLSEQLQKVNLNSQAINEEILNALYLIIRFCVYKEYVRAHDKYLELAIGNAPWPMGVTMVGIHERTGRSKISSSQIAHILNDETQRKYIQAIKRLITVSQKTYPSKDRSKMVDFRTEYAW